MTVAEPKSPQAKARERAEKIVSDLAKRGESRTKGIQKAAREIAERSSWDRRDLMKLIQKEIKRQVEVLGLARRAEIERLQKRVEELESSAPSRRKPSSKTNNKKKPTS